MAELRYGTNNVDTLVVEIQINLDATNAEEVAQMAADAARLAYLDRTGQTPIPPVTDAPASDG